MGEIIIDKVINNNIISAFEESGTEVVVMGRGIGFKKKPGQTVPSEQVEKIFRMKSKTLAEQLKEFSLICRWSAWRFQQRLLLMQKIN